MLENIGLLKGSLGEGQAAPLAGLSAAAVVDSLHQAALIEAFAAVCLLRMKEGPKIIQASPLDLDAKDNPSN